MKITESAENAPSLQAERVSGADRATEARDSFWPRRVVGAAVFVLLLSLLFGKELFSLFVSAFGSDLNSYIVLVPFAAAYLFYTEWERLPHLYTPAKGLAAAAALLGFGIVACALVQPPFFSGLSQNDWHVVRTSAFVCLIWAGGFAFLGGKWMRKAAFPVAFLVFLIPLPDVVVQCLESGLKLASTQAASWFFAMSGTTFAREGTVFQLPGFTIRVAQECSGIKSSWILFITSLVAGHLFLATPGRRMILAAAVIPLGILRNGFRIMVIGLLCIHIGPEMIDSPLHRRGGPIFFALSLVPLWLLLWLLKKRQRNAESKNG